MRLVTMIRQRLALKIFLSHLVIIVVGVAVLSGTALIQAPIALDRHIVEMRALTGDNPTLVTGLIANFNAAILEILAVAASASVLAAVLVSTFVARRIVGPVDRMMQASQRIADGKYAERVHVPGDDELGSLAHSFNRMAETLAWTEQRRLELLGNVAHELRTPLSGIKGTMEGLIDGLIPAEPATYVLVSGEVSRLQRLVGDLEELSRAEAGRIPLDRRPVGLADLALSVVERLRSQFEDKGVELSVEVPASVAEILADPARLSQVLLNLLGNALQYTPEGGLVTISSRRQGGSVLTSVQDTGIGISDADLPHIFERFYRVDKSRARSGGGSGIGLTIAKHLVEAHGGHIWAESAGLGRGSTFKFSLPAAYSPD